VCKSGRKHRRPLTQRPPPGEASAQILDRELKSACILIAKRVSGTRSRCCYLHLCLKYTLKCALLGLLLVLLRHSITINTLLC
jgi:hypothetical protein